MGIIYLIYKYYPYLISIIFTNIIYTHLSYSHTVEKNSHWYIVACVVCGMVSNTAWAVLMQVTKDNAERFLLGQVWDFIPLVTFLLIPPLVYGVGLAGWKLWLGLAMIIAGTILISYSDKL